MRQLACFLFALALGAVNSARAETPAKLQALVRLADELLALSEWSPAAVGSVLGTRFEAEGSTAEQCRGSCNFRALGAGDVREYYLINNDKFKRVFFFFRSEVKLEEYRGGGEGQPGTWTRDPPHRKHMKATWRYALKDYTIYFETTPDSNAYIEQAWISKDD